MPSRRLTRFAFFVLCALAVLTTGLALFVFVRRSEPIAVRAGVTPFLVVNRPLIFAHRGDSAGGAENMLPAFRRAALAGADVLELDIHRTADDVVVVIHDATLLRTAGVDRAVADLTFAELERIDNGARFRRMPNGELRAPRPAELEKLAAGGATEPVEYPLRGRGLRVPRLATVFETFPNRLINIEIKADDPLLARLLWRDIERHRRQDSVLVGSTHGDILRIFRRLSGGKVATGATFGEVLSFWFCFQVDIPCRGDYVALQIPHIRGVMGRLPGPTGDLSRPEFMAFARRHGIATHYWTVNRSEDIRDLLAAGADGIMTDYTRKAVAVRDELARASRE